MWPCLSQHCAFRNALLAIVFKKYLFMFQATLTLEIKEFLVPSFKRATCMHNHRTVVCNIPVCMSFTTVNRISWFMLKWMVLAPCFVDLQIDEYRVFVDGKLHTAMLRTDAKSTEAQSVSDINTSSRHRVAYFVEGSNIIEVCLIEVRADRVRFAAILAFHCSPHPDIRHFTACSQSQCYRGVTIMDPMSFRWMHGGSPMVASQTISHRQRDRALSLDPIVSAV